MASPGQRLRELIEAPGILVMPGIYDGFSARLVEAALGQSLEEGRVIERPDLLVSFDEINTLMGLPQLREIEGRYLSAAERERKYGDRA